MIRRLLPENGVEGRYKTADVRKHIINQPNGCEKVRLCRSPLLLGKMIKWGACLKHADFISFTKRVYGYIYT